MFSFTLSTVLYIKKLHISIDISIWIDISCNLAGTTKPSSSSSSHSTFSSRHSPSFTSNNPIIHPSTPARILHTPPLIHPSCEQLPIKRLTLFSFTIIHDFHPSGPNLRSSLMLIPTYPPKPNPLTSVANTNAFPPPLLWCVAMPLPVMLLWRKIVLVRKLLGWEGEQSVGRQRVEVIMNVW